MNAIAAKAEFSSDAPLLEVKNVYKTFGATRALRGVSLDVRKGEILALLGENGAGKSTLIKTLAGVHAQDEGEICFGGVPLHALGSEHGMSFIHQDHGLIEWMTVAENISMSLGFPKKFGLIDWNAVERRAKDALAQIGADIDPNARIKSLNRTERSLVAISRALVANAELLVLDEPTASLPADEVIRLFEVLRKLKDRNVGMIYVSHRLDEVFEIADRMVILRDGQVVGNRIVSSTNADETIVSIVGSEPSKVFVKHTHGLGDEKLKLKDFRVGNTGPVNLSVRAGEVVGLVGLRGAGQEHIGRGLFGLAEEIQGQVEIDGVDVHSRSPEEAISNGVCLVWGDRTAGSIVPTLSIQENLYLNPGAKGKSPWSLLNISEEAESAARVGTKLQLRPNRPELPIESLSGGNQQKVVIGRWLHLQGKVYIFEDPTAGVDVGAKAEIYKLFDEAAEKGACILVVSTDFEEVANICHRAVVFDRNRVVAELHQEQLTLNSLLAAASASLH